VDRDNTGKPLPKYSNGYFIFYSHDGAIASYSSSGALAAQFTVTLPGKTRFLVMDACAWPDGAMAIALSAAGGMGSAIVIASSSGQLERTVQTAPFGVAKVVCAPNRRLWAAGWDGSPGHDTLREYDSEGRFLQSILPGLSFPEFLVANDHSFGLYSLTANEFIRLDWSGTVTSRRATPPIARSSAVIISAALTPAGDLYLGGVAKATGGQSVTLRWDRSANSFHPVAIPEAAGDEVRTMNVLGAAGNHLIFYTKPSGMARVSIP